MQCLNCEFENMPGMARCVRCNSALDLGDVAVLPPRATRWRILTHWSRRWHAFTTTLHALWASRPRWANMTRTDVTWHAVAWSLLPGIGLIKKGSKAWGYAVFGVWMALLLATVLTVGLPASPVLLNATVLVHVTSALWFLGGELNYYRRLTVALFSLVVFAGLRLFIYQPVVWFGRQFYVPLSPLNMTPGNVVQNEDGLLYEGAWTRPDRFERGEIVLYDIAGLQYGQTHLLAGEGLDRIIGVPGDRVTIRDGVLHVNGQPLDPRLVPLGRANISIAGNDVQLGADEYLIFPSRLRLTAYGDVPTVSFLSRLSRVPTKSIRGRIVFRLHPWSRFGRLE